MMVDGQDRSTARMFYGLLDDRRTLLVILILAALVRLPGVFSGLPTFNQYMPANDYFHPDEGKITWRAMKFPEDVEARVDLRYPTAMHNLTGFVALPLRFIPALPESVHRDLVYLIGRSISVAFAVGAVWLTERLGRTLLSRRAGVLAALFLCLSLYHVRNAGWATTDVATSFWAALTVLLGYHYFQRPEWRTALWLGASVGMLVGFKYTGVFVVLVLAIWLIQSLISRQAADVVRNLLPGLIVAAIVSVAVFVLTTPTALIKPWALVESLAYESARVAGVKSAGGVISSVWVGITRLVETANLPIAMFALAGILLLIVDRPYRRWMLAFVGMLVVYIAYFDTGLAGRYMITVLPFVCLIAGYAAFRLIDWVPPRWSHMAIPLLVVVIGFSFLNVINLWLYTFPDTRTELNRFLYEAQSRDADLSFEVSRYGFEVPNSHLFTPAFVALPNEGELGDYIIFSFSPSNKSEAHKFAHEGFEGYVLVKVFDKPRFAPVEFTNPIFVVFAREDYR